MALDPNRLGVALAAAVTANAPSDDDPVSASKLEQMWIAIAQEIIGEFEANGIVTVLNVQAGTETASGGIS